MHHFGRPEGDFSTFAKSEKEKRSKSNSLRVHFALVFLPHTGFSFRGRMGRWSEGKKVERSA